MRANVQCITERSSPATYQASAWLLVPPPPAPHATSAPARGRSRAGVDNYGLSGTHGYQDLNAHKRGGEIGGGGEGRFNEQCMHACLHEQCTIQPCMYCSVQVRALHKGLTCTRAVGAYSFDTCTLCTRGP